MPSVHYNGPEHRQIVVFPHGHFQVGKTSNSGGEQRRCTVLCDLLDHTEAHVGHPSSHPGNVHILSKETFRLKISIAYIV